MKQFLYIFLLCSFSYAQSSIEDMKTINNNVWIPFEKAFNTFDNSIMREIHSPELIRLSASSQNIRDYVTYMNDNQNSFKKKILSNSKSDFTLRFTERINNDSIASEHGIYRLVSNLGKDNEYISYGKFHVLLKKEVNKWKIIFDYDSDENKTIGLKQFNEAFEKADFVKFIK